MEGPTTLAFPDRKSDGVLPVLGVDGNPVATIRAATRQRSSFEVDGPGGVKLCAVKKTGHFSRTYEVTDAENHPLLTLKQGWGTSATVRTADGREYMLAGRSRSFALTAADGETIARAGKGKTGGLFRSDDYAVEVRRSDFTVGELVAVVEIHRRTQKRRRTAAVAHG
jgi:hypothetical protein